ncbi:MAG: mannose-6-phosphate isomerase, class I [Spirochaetaceae bacterium]|jgi:mannose-6-phosphate isomerase|nr:mannose-6-phosphate isomerase, class I [Spirochaetaceae bacterium]
MKFYKLDNPIKHYDWGSSTEIPAFLGRPNPDNTPWAEMWMGSHPAGPSKVLGAEAGWTMPHLKWLFKLLAAEKPLSIQAHPNKQQAEEGFARENALGIPLDSPLRNYKDDNHKPEIICAITPFTALCGFKDEAAIELYRTIMHGNNGGGGTAPTVGAGLKPAPTPLQQLLQQLYPGDPGVYAPLYLNVITLQPGEAIFLPAGVLHAYVHGFGFELMAASDNVLRGGLTNKHIDKAELEKILLFEPYKPEILHPPIVKEDFSFEMISSSRKGAKARRINAPGIIIIKEGIAELACGGETITLRKGESALINIKNDETFETSGTFSGALAHGGKGSCIS